MPQRKEYDVYSGNQKVGEVWGHYDNKTPSEADMNIKIAACNLIRAEAEVATDEKKIKKKKRMTVNYIVRAVIGAVVLIVIFTTMNKLGSDSFRGSLTDIWENILPFAIPGAIAVSFITSTPTLNIKKCDTSINWAAAFSGLIFGFIGVILFAWIWY